MIPVAIRMDSAPRSHFLRQPAAACVHVTPAPSKKLVLVLGAVDGPGGRLAFDPSTVVLASLRLSGVAPRLDTAGGQNAGILPPAVPVI